MVESEAKELPEEAMLGAVVYGHEQMQAVINAINELADDSVKLVFTDRSDDGVARLTWFLGGHTASLSQLLPMLQSMGVVVLEERPFTVEEGYGAREAFLTSASQIVMPVVRIDDRPVGNGAPGSVATALRAEFHHHAERT